MGVNDDRLQAMNCYARLLSELLKTLLADTQRHPAIRKSCLLSSGSPPPTRSWRRSTVYGELPPYRAILDREGAASPSDIALVVDEDAVAAPILALADAGMTDFVAADLARGQDREGPAAC